MGMSVNHSTGLLLLKTLPLLAIFSNNLMEMSESSWVILHPERIKKTEKAAYFTITIIPSGLIEKGTNVKAGITSKNAKG